MIRTNKKKFGAHYKKEAPYYDSRRTCVHEKLYEDLIKKALQVHLGNSQKGGKVLDAGCGTGRFTIFLAERGFSVTSLDFSKQMLEIVRQKIKNKKYPKIELRKGDIEKLPFKNNTFDIAFSYAVIRHFQDPSLSIKELVRVTKPGGIIIFDFLNRRYYWPLILLKKMLGILDKDEVKKGFFANYYLDPKKALEILNQFGVNRIDKTRCFFKFPAHLLLCQLKLPLRKLIKNLEQSNWGGVCLVKAVK